MDVENVDSMQEAMSKPIRYSILFVFMEREGMLPFVRAFRGGDNPMSEFPSDERNHRPHAQLPECPHFGGASSPW